MPGLIAEESEPLAEQSAALISCLDQLFLAAKVSEKEINKQKLIKLYINVIIYICTHIPVGG